MMSIVKKVRGLVQILENATTMLIITHISMNLCKYTVLTKTVNLSTLDYFKEMIGSEYI